MLRTERAQLAGLNNALLASPAGSFIGGSPRMGGSPLLGGSPFLGAGGLSPGYRGGAGLRRVRSFSSAPLGSMGMGHHRLHSPHASPRIMPVPVPMPMQQQRPVVNYNVSRPRRSPSAELTLTFLLADVQRIPARTLASSPLAPRKSPRRRPRSIRRSQRHGRPQRRHYRSSPLRRWRWKLRAWRCNVSLFAW